MRLVCGTELNTYDTEDYPTGSLWNKVIELGIESQTHLLSSCLIEFKNEAFPHSIYLSI